MIETKHLFTMPVEVEMPLQMVGRTPIGERRIAKVTSGSFAGPELNGKILPGGRRLVASARRRRPSIGRPGHAQDRR